MIENMLNMDAVTETAEIIDRPWSVFRDNSGAVAIVIHVINERAAAENDLA